MTNLAAALRSGEAPETEFDDVALARGRLYRLLSLTLGDAPDDRALAALAQIEGDDTPLGRACAALAAAAAATTAEQAERAHFDLFVGVGRGELLPFASFYLTGFLHERPLAAVRDDLTALGVVRRAGLHDPEDHVAILCGVMAGLADGSIPATGAVDEARFFARHLQPWAGRFFEDLARARPTGLHAAIGALGAAFMAVEAEAFALEQ